MSIFSLSLDISSAIRSVANVSTMALKLIPKLFSVPGDETDHESLSPADDQDEGIEG